MLQTIGGLIGEIVRGLTALGAASWFFRDVAGRNPTVRGALDRWSRRRPWFRRRVAVVFGVAAGLSLAATVLPRLFVALHVRRWFGRRWTGRPIVGQSLPTLSGRTLGGRSVSFPDEARGRAACLVLGFAYESRFDVEDWVEAFKRRFGGSDQIALYELPMISSLYLPISGAIEAGMRGGTPRESFDQVVTVYGWPASLRRALGADTRSDTWVFAIDRSGTVLYQFGGPYDDGHFAELASALLAASATRAA